MKKTGFGNMTAILLVLSTIAITLQGCGAVERKVDPDKVLETNFETVDPDQAAAKIAADMSKIAAAIHVYRQKEGEWPPDYNCGVPNKLSALLLQKTNLDVYPVPPKGSGNAGDCYEFWNAYDQIGGPTSEGDAVLQLESGRMDICLSLNEASSSLGRNAWDSGNPSGSYPQNEAIWCMLWSKDNLSILKIIELR